MIIFLQQHQHGSRLSVGIKVVVEALLSDVLSTGTAVLDPFPIRAFAEDCCWCFVCCWSINQVNSTFVSWFAYLIGFLKFVSIRSGCNESCYMHVKIQHLRYGSAFLLVQVEVIGWQQSVKLQGHQH